MWTILDFHPSSSMRSPHWWCLLSADVLVGSLLLSAVLAMSIVIAPLPPSMSKSTIAQQVNGSAESFTAKNQLKSYAQSYSDQGDSSNALPVMTETSLQRWYLPSKRVSLSLKGIPYERLSAVNNAHNGWMR